MKLLDGKENGFAGFLSDLELSLDDLDKLDAQLSDENEELLKEIGELYEKINEQPTLMQDMLEAVKKGSMSYLDSMIDTGDVFNEAKDPKSVSQLSNSEIDKKNKPATLERTANWQTRTMKDAKKNPMDLNAADSVTGMSAKGAIKFGRYRKCYEQRTKSITAISSDGNTIKYKSDNSQNFESLSGLRSYRFGPIVSMPSVQETKEEYERSVQQGKAYSMPGFIRKKNFSVFEKRLMDEFGFKTKSEARQWYQDNHLTIHEGPDGMFLVPTDVHGAVSHSGYCSKLVDVLKGKDGAEEALNLFKAEETRHYIKHEVKNRGVRAIKGVGLTAIKDVMKHSIVIICKETYSEFKEESKDSFIDRIKRILKKYWESVKVKAGSILANIWGNIQGSLLSEFLTALNDFLFGTFKNIFKIVRQMFGSIKSAFKLICSKKSSWEDRIFEASKILSAGVVAIIGFSLNELIEKGLTTIGIPFASFIAECLSGLFSGILSALVLMIFDHIKSNLDVRDEKLKMVLLQSKSITIDVARIHISSLRVNREMYEAHQFFAYTYDEIMQSRVSIIERQIDVNSTIEEAKIQISEETKHIEKLNNLLSDGECF